MSVLRQQQSYFTTSQQNIQQTPKNDEPIASYLAELNKKSKRNIFDSSHNTLQKRKSSGVFDKIMSKKKKPTNLNLVFDYILLMILKQECFYSNKKK